MTDYNPKIINLENVSPPWVTFNLLIEKVNFKDVIGHLFVFKNKICIFLNMHLNMRQLKIIF